MKEKGEKKVHGLGGRAERAGKRGSPWEVDTRAGKKGQGMEAGGRQGREEDIKLIQAGRHQAHGRG